ncbi:2127_t:CDS:1, partial [Gigaspora margarita]
FINVYPLRNTKLQNPTSLMYDSFKIREDNEPSDLISAEAAL